MSAPEPPAPSAPLLDARDLAVATVWLTRLPAPVDPDVAMERAAAAAWAYPIIGLGVGAIVGAVAGGLAALGVAPLAAAMVALGVGALATGALHEDGLSDVADGFGGGADRARVLEIMRDSRIGAFGAAALIVSFGARAGALAGIAALDPWAAVAAAVAAGALSRGAMVVVMAAAPLARADGLAARVGRPSRRTAALAAALAVAAAGWVGLFVAIPAALGAAAIAVWARRRIGGATGDVYGAAQQVSEIFALLALSAR